MIYNGTILKVADNSGAKRAICIGTIFCKRRYAKLGDIIKVSIKKCSKKSRVKKGTIYNAIVINTKYPFFRNGFMLRFEENSIVLLDNKYNVFSTRIFGISLKEFKKTDFGKICSISDYVI
ncbi:50S ribosomal protein L14 [Candidatus Vidania fulgoroideorum]